MKRFTVIFCVFALLAVGCQPDDGKVTVQDQPAPQNPSQAALPVLRNLNMTEGTTRPAEWKYVWTGMGKVEAIRDTEVFKGSPASLSIRSMEGYAEGHVCQHFLPVGAPFVVSGFARVVGKQVDLCQVAVQVINSHYQQIAWIRLISVPADDGWHEFHKIIQLPPDAAHCMLTLAFHGDGQAWLDEVTVAPAE